MKTVGIAIDSWKLPIFTRRLEGAGYTFTRHPGVTSGTLMLKVKTDLIAPLQKVIEAAQLECSERRTK